MVYFCRTWAQASFMMKSLYLPEPFGSLDSVQKGERLLSMGTYPLRTAWTMRYPAMVSNAQLFESDPLIKLNCHSDVIMVASLCHLVSLSASWQSLAFHKAQSITFLTSGFRYSRMASTRRAKLQQWKLKHTMQNSCKGDVGYINKWSWARRRRCLMPFPFKVLHSAVLCWLCFPLYQ